MRLCPPHLGRQRRGRTVFEKNGSWTALYRDEYPPATEARKCFELPDGSKTAAGCAEACDKTPGCRYFWTYTAGKSQGTCCLKTGIEPGPLQTPVCRSCGGVFAAMDGRLVHVNATEFDSWTGEPAIVETGTRDHQLYSQITWRFYDVFLGIVMTFDAEDPAGHVHCALGLGFILIIARGIPSATAPIPQCVGLLLCGRADRMLTGACNLTWCLIHVIPCRHAELVEQLQGMAVGRPRRARGAEGVHPGRPERELRQPRLCVRAETWPSPAAERDLSCKCQPCLTLRSLHFSLLSLSLSPSSYFLWHSLALRPVSRRSSWSHAPFSATGLFLLPIGDWCTRGWRSMPCRC